MHLIRWSRPLHRRTDKVMRAFRLLLNLLSASGRPRPETPGKMVRRDALKVLLSLAAGGAVLPFYARWVEPNWIQVQSLRIRIPGLDPAFHGMTVVHTSDLHLDGVWGTPERLASWVERIQALRPDAVVVTGDWVTTTAGLKVLERAAPVLARLRAPMGVFGVLGNHDHWADPHAVRQALRAAGVRELKNETHVWEIGRARLALVGLDDPWSRPPRWEEVARLAPNGMPAIILVHEPDFADQVARLGRFSLQLSGHSHGGQVKIPGVGAPFLPLHGQKYPEGLYRIGRMTLYTNRGLGMVPPRIRLFARPEITHITLAAW